MPVFTFKLDDFNKLIGKQYDIKYLEERLPMMGLAWEGVEDDNKIKVEIFPNRPDMLSVEGLARAFAGFDQVKVGLPEYRARPTDQLVKVEESVKKVRPYIVVATVSNLEFTETSFESLISFQEALHLTHCRYRKKASIGVYDADTIKFPLTYKAIGLDDLKFTPLLLDEPKEMTPREILQGHPTGKKFAHLVREKAPLLIDSVGQVLSFPPIINSEETKVTIDTKRVVIDVTGESLVTVHQTLNMLVSALADRGGIIEQVTIQYPWEIEGRGNVIITPDVNPPTYTVDVNYLKKRSGLNLPTSKIKQLLERMRFSVKVNNKSKKLHVTVPAYRTDIFHPIDFVEDLVIAYGFENITPEIPSIATVGRESDIEIFTRLLANYIIGFGAQEVMTYVLTNPDFCFKKMGLEYNETRVAAIQNPTSQRYTICRTWLLPSMLEVLSNNTHHDYPQRIFEIGDCVKVDKNTETKAVNERRLAYVETHSQATFTDGKAVLEALMMHLGHSYRLEELEHPTFIKGRAASIYLINPDNNEKVYIGMMGEIHPEILLSWGLTHPVVALEMLIEPLLERRVF